MAAENHAPIFDDLEELQTLFMTMKQAAIDAISMHSTHSKDAALWMIEKLSDTAARDIEHLLKKEPG